MVPDVPMFVRIPGSYAVTHSLAGVFTVDVVLGMLGVAVWFGLVRDALVDVAPSAVRERLDPSARYSRMQWVLVPVAVALGALSHVVWDAFTHRDRWGVEHVEWLRHLHGGLMGSAWAQYVSGGLGLVIVGACAVDSLRMRSRRSRLPRVPDLGVRALAVVVLAIATITVVAALSRAPEGLHAMAFRGAVIGTIALVVGALALAVTWHLRARHGVLAARPLQTP